MSIDRRTDGPTLLRAEVGPARRWGRRRQTVHVTSRRLWWGPTGSESSLDWADVIDVRSGDDGMVVTHTGPDGALHELRVALVGPVGYLVAEEVERRSAAARRNAATAGAGRTVAC